MTLIRIGNTGSAEEFGPSIGRTAFQTEYVREVASRPDVAFFAMNPKCDTRYQGPFLLTFFTRAGRICSDWVGQHRVLDRRVSDQPIELGGAYGD